MLDRVPRYIAGPVARPFTTEEIAEALGMTPIDERRMSIRRDQGYDSAYLRQLGANEQGQSRAVLTIRCLYRWGLGPRFRVRQEGLRTDLHPGYSKLKIGLAPADRGAGLMFRGAPRAWAQEALSSQFESLNTLAQARRSLPRSNGERIEQDAFLDTLDRKTSMQRLRNVFALVLNIAHSDFFGFERLMALPGTKRLAGHEMGIVIQYPISVEIIVRARRRRFYTELRTATQASVANAGDLNLGAPAKLQAKDRWLSIEFTEVQTETALLLRAASVLAKAALGGVGPYR